VEFQTKEYGFARFTIICLVHPWKRPICLVSSSSGSGRAPIHLLLSQLLAFRVLQCLAFPLGNAVICVLSCFLIADCSFSFGLVDVISPFRIRASFNTFFSRCPTHLRVARVELQQLPFGLPKRMSQSCFLLTACSAVEFS
jgi:hypothetical protein